MPYTPLVLGSQAAATAADVANALTFLALVVGGVVGLRRYRHALRIQSAELLLQLEDEYRRVLPTCVRWETASSYRKDIAPVLERYAEEASLSDPELEVLGDVDRCLRFFYLCTVMHHDLKIEQAIVARSYYWWAAQLLDRERRPQLHDYVRRHYRRLHEWLVRHEPCFAHYGATGVWEDRRARSETEARALIRELDG